MPVWVSHIPCIDIHKMIQVLPLAGHLSELSAHPSSQTSFLCLPNRSASVCPLRPSAQYPIAFPVRPRAPPRPCKAESLYCRGLLTLTSIYATLTLALAGPGCTMGQCGRGYPPQPPVNVVLETLQSPVPYSLWSWECPLPPGRGAAEKHRGAPRAKCRAGPGMEGHEGLTAEQGQGWRGTKGSVCLEIE